MVDLTAVVHRRKVRLTYTNSARERSVRLGAPWGLVDKDDIWYLVAGTERGQGTFRVAGSSTPSRPTSRPNAPTTSRSTPHGSRSSARWSRGGPGAPAALGAVRAGPDRHRARNAVRRRTLSTTDVTLPPLSDDPGSRYG
jgi:hypothetical protein